MSRAETRIYCGKLTKNLRYPRRTKLPPDVGSDRFWKDIPKENIDSADEYVVADKYDDTVTDDEEEEEEEEVEGREDNHWDQEEIEAISSLFRGRVPQKPGNLDRKRPLPLPLPYKIRPLGLPLPKRHARKAISSRLSVSNQVYKNPSFLIQLAKEIRTLHADEDVCKVLNKSSHFLRKGSLSLTIRELAHMGLPQRALQTFSWAEKQAHLYPDDRILGSTVEVLARAHQLKMPLNLMNFATVASRSVIEAMVKGFIKGGSLELAWKVMSIAEDNKRILDSSIYAKLILELGKNPDKQMMVLTLLEELAERDDMDLSQQDCTAIMKVCTRIGKFELVESLFNWFRQSERDVTVVMYTTVIRSLYCEKKYKEALALVWEMEGSNCLLDLPAYRVVIKLFVTLNDLPRAVRYFSKLKEAGFSPSYDIYRDLFTIFAAFGRVAKCKEVCKEAELAGFALDKHMSLQLLQLKR